VTRAIHSFPDLLRIVLVWATVCQSGCRGVREELFVVDPAEPMGQAGMQGPAPEAGGSATGADVTDATASVPQAGVSGVDSSAESNPSRGANVTFNWSESIPGAGACRAAWFNGTFSCEVEALLDAADPEILIGSIVFHLGGSSEAQTLTVENGQISAYDESSNNVFIAGVTGSLDCSTQHLECSVDPTPTNPMPIERQLRWLNPDVQPHVTGTLKGSLNPDLQEISGDLELVFEPSPRCVGTFQVR